MHHSILIIGPPSSPLFKLPEDWITESEVPDAYNVTLQWDLPDNFENFISQYVVTVAPEIPPCGSGLCVVTSGMREFGLRELTFTMGVGQTYNVTIRSDNTQIGETSNSFPLILHGEHIHYVCIQYCIHLPCNVHSDCMEGSQKIGCFSHTHEHPCMS